MGVYSSVAVKVQRIFRGRHARALVRKLREAAEMAALTTAPTVGGTSECAGCCGGAARLLPHPPSRGALPLAGPLLSTGAVVSGVYLLVNIFRPDVSLFIAEAFDPSTNTAFVVRGRSGDGRGSATAGFRFI